MCNDMRKLQNKRKSMRNKKGTLLGRIPFSKMREMGLEPTRAYTHKILSLACLPIPALPLTCRFSQTTSESIANVFLFVKSFFHFFRRLNFPLQIYFLSVCHLPDK